MKDPHTIAYGAGLEELWVQLSGRTLLSCLALANSEGPMYTLLDEMVTGLQDKPGLATRLPYTLRDLFGGSSETTLEPASFCQYARVASLVFTLTLILLAPGQAGPNYINI